MALPDATIARIGEEVFTMLAAPHEVAPYTERFPGYGLADAYRVVEEMRRRREAMGQKLVGRKIGFTNATAWAGHGISEPIWNYLYDASTWTLPPPGGTFDLGHWPNIRMEAEVALGLGRAPEAAMTDAELLDCVDWVALDFEVCTSIFPDWQFQVADAATTGVHVGLLLGPRHGIVGSRRRWGEQLAAFTATLSEAQGARATGGGSQVLGSPIKALGYLVKELARFGGEPLQAGEMVTTGTLTAALPGAPGERWRAEANGIDLAPIDVTLSGGLHRPHIGARSPQT